MTYEPFAVLLKPYWDMPLSGVPAALSTRTIAEGVYALWGGWDALGPEGRQSVAEGHDAMLDPARKGERESSCKLNQEIEQCLESIALREKTHPQTITEIGAKEAKLATLNEELATLQQRLVAPYREAAAVQPATELRPVTPAPAEDVGALSEPDKAAPVVTAKKRRDSITPVIEQAQSKCKDSSDTAEVWGHMEVLAENEVPPFQGRMVEGLKYTKKGEVCYFTRDALRLRLHPELRAPRK